MSRAGTGSCDSKCLCCEHRKPCSQPSSSSVPGFFDQCGLGVRGKGGIEQLRLAVEHSRSLLRECSCEVAKVTMIVHLSAKQGVVKVQEEWEGVQLAQDGGWELMLGRSYTAVNGWRAWGVERKGDGEEPSLVHPRLPSCIKLKHPRPRLTLFNFLTGRCTFCFFPPKAKFSGSMCLAVGVAGRNGDPLEPWTAVGPGIVSKNPGNHFPNILGLPVCARSP